jgi:hypothetical protein
MFYQQKYFLRLSPSCGGNKQSMGRHVTPLGHIILFPSQPVLTLSSKCCVLNTEATNTNFIFFRVGVKQQSLTHSLSTSFKRVILRQLCQLPICFNMKGKFVASISFDEVRLINHSWTAKT